MTDTDTKRQQLIARLSRGLVYTTPLLIAVTGAASLHAIVSDIQDDPAGFSASEGASDPASSGNTDATPEASPEASPEATPEASPEAAPEATPEAAPEATPEAGQ